MGCGGSSASSAFASENDKNMVMSHGTQNDSRMHGLERETEANAAAELMGVDATNSVIELSVACKSLTRRDRFSQSDPFCVCYVEDFKSSYAYKDAASTVWKELGRTEIIANTSNPSWIGKFLLDYHFEIVQRLKFEIYDCDTSFVTSDSSLLELPKQDFLGRFETTLSKICSSNLQVLEADLSGGTLMNAPYGTISIRAEEIANTTDEFKLQMKVSGLTPMLQGCNPFLVLCKQNEDGGYVPCLKTEVISGSTDPLFSEVAGPLIRLCNGDVSRPLIVKAYSWKHNGKHIYIGETMCNIQMMMEIADSKEALPLVNKETGKTGVSGASAEPEVCGQFGVVQCKLIEKASFLDYLRGGLELNFIVAIDFTASNGDPATPDSLHYIPPSGRASNTYINAIRSVSSVLEFYDFDRKFPCYGFGAKLSKGGVVDHCFPLSGDDSNNSALGTEGIIDLYRKKLPQLHFAGPTVFTNVIYRAANFAKSLSQTPSQKYVILLIITDGTINDMDNCIDAIVAVSSQPMSIIIVGVGNEDFSGMVKLDGDKQMLKSRTGKKAERDIVQFTALKDMQKIVDQAKAGGSVLEVHDLVSRDLLAEVPAQVTEYFTQRNITPLADRGSGAFSRSSSRARAEEVRSLIDQVQATGSIPNAPTRLEGDKKRSAVETHSILLENGPEGTPSCSVLPRDASRTEWFDTDESEYPTATPAITPSGILPSYSTVIRGDVDTQVGEQGLTRDASRTEWFDTDDLKDPNPALVEVSSGILPPYSVIAGEQVTSQPDDGEVSVSHVEDQWFDAEDD